MQTYTKHRDSLHTSANFCAADRVISGICRGTSLLTKDGDRRVEHLHVGDKIITRRGATTLRRIVRKKRAFRPIRILASSLGHNRPDRDMYSTPSALIHIRDWRAQAIFGTIAANVPAWRLVDGEFVSQQEINENEVFELYFDELQVLFADGIQVLSAED